MKLVSRKYFILLKEFGIDEFLDDNMSMSLGSGLVKLIDMTNAYGIIANGGKKIQPNFIESIYDRKGKLVFKSYKEDIVIIV